MSYNNYQGNYPGQAQGPAPTHYSGAPPTGYPGQAPGVPPTGYPGQAPRAPPTGYYGQAPGVPPTGYPGQTHEVRQTAYSGQQATVPQQPATAPGYASQGGNFAGANPSVNSATASWFRAVDQDNSGQINASELRLALQNGNWSQFSEEACNLMISMFDKNHTGTIDLQEFDQLFSFVNQWTETYQRYDQDKSGTISKSEMNTALQQMGYRLSKEFVGFLVTKYSSKARRGITLDNFILINIKIRNLTEAFRRHDREMKGVITVPYEDFLSMVLLSV